MKKRLIAGMFVGVGLAGMVNSTMAANFHEAANFHDLAEEAKGIKVLKKGKSYWKKYLIYNWLATDKEAEFWCEEAKKDRAKKFEKDYQNKKKGKKICR